MAEWKDILNDNERSLSDEELLSYINEQTSASDKKRIAELAIDSFENDALEGLQGITNPGVTRKHVAELKQDLQKKLRSKKGKRFRKKTSEMQWIIFAAVLLLLVVILTFTILKMIEKS